ncbi:MAG: hypothetical protein QOI95_566 [Acidimicrobiaceae bacterium]
MRTTLALGRFEARCLRRSIALWIGVAGSVWILQLVAFGRDDSLRDPMLEQAANLSRWVHPLCATLVFAWFRASARSRRDHTDELFDACPTARAGRTRGHLASAWLAVAFAAVFVIVCLAGARLFRDAYGPIDAEVIAEALSAVVLVIGACWLGVLLGRMTRFGLSPVLVLVVILVADFWLWRGLGGDVGRQAGPPRAAQLATTANWPIPDLVFSARPVGWHLLYVAGLAALCAVAAIALHDRSRRVVFVALAVLGVTAVSAASAVRPLTDPEIRRIAALVDNPVPHQVCSTRGPVTACLYEKYRDGLLELLDASDGVVAATPEAVQARGFRISQRLHPRDLDGLDDRVLALVRPDVRAAVQVGFPEDGMWHVPFRGGRAVVMATRLAAGAWAVGLPLAEHSGSCDASYQARSVIAMWLAAHDLAPSDRDESRLRGFSLDWSDTESPVTWSGFDWDAARILLARPNAEVEAALHAGWDRYTDPTTTTAQLMADFGSIFPEQLPPSGPDPDAQFNVAPRPCPK